MKTRTVIAGNIALLMLATAALQAADQMTTYNREVGQQDANRRHGQHHPPHLADRKPDHRGHAGGGPGLPDRTRPGGDTGQDRSQREGVHQVRSLKSVEEDGKPYSDRMDEVTYEHLKEAQFKQIDLQADRTHAEGSAQDQGCALCVRLDGRPDRGRRDQEDHDAGEYPAVLDPKEKKLEITGNITVKMTDFKVAPVDINLVVGHIKTGDEVKLVFKWIARAEEGRRGRSQVAATAVTRSSAGIVRHTGRTLHAANRVSQSNSGGGS